MDFSKVPNLRVRSYSKESQVADLLWEDPHLEITYQEICKTWHEKRQKEFLLGRHLIHQTLKENKEAWQNPILMGDKREPLFPKGISGSLTHNENFVVFSFSKGECTVGIDIESRGRVKEKLEKEILREEDFEILDTVDFKNSLELNRQDLVTIIFSAKESCFKGLYPLVQEYFGFQDAHVAHLDLQQKTFSLVVLKSFPTLKNPLRLSGGFIYNDSNIFSYLTPADFNDFR